MPPRAAAHPAVICAGTLLPGSPESPFLRRSASVPPPTVAPPRACGVFCALGVCRTACRLPLAQLVSRPHLRVSALPLLRPGLALLRRVEQHRITLLYILVNCACWPSLGQYIHTYIHCLGPNASARASRSHYPHTCTIGRECKHSLAPSVQYACAQTLRILPRTLHLRHPTPQHSQ